MPDSAEIRDLKRQIRQLRSSLNRVRKQAGHPTESQVEASKQRLWSAISNVEAGTAEQFEEAYQSLLARLQTAGCALQEQVSKRPLTLLAAAAGLGIVLGSLRRR